MRNLSNPIFDVKKSKFGKSCETKSPCFCLKNRNLRKKTWFLTILVDDRWGANPRGPLWLSGCVLFQCMAVLDFYTYKILYFFSRNFARKHKSLWKHVYGYFIGASYTWLCCFLVNGQLGSNILVQLFSNYIFLDHAKIIFFCVCEILSFFFVIFSPLA